MDQCVIPVIIKTINHNNVTIHNIFLILVILLKICQLNNKEIPLKVNFIKEVN